MSYKYLLLAFLFIFSYSFSSAQLQGTFTSYNKYLPNKGWGEDIPCRIRFYMDELSSNPIGVKLTIYTTPISKYEVIDLAGAPVRKSNGDLKSDFVVKDEYGKIWLLLMNYFKDDNLIRFFLYEGDIRKSLSSKVVTPRLMYDCQL